MKNKTKVEIWGVYPPPVGGISAYCNKLAGALHVMDESVILKNFARSRSRCDYVKDVRCRLLEILKLPFVSRRIIHVQLCNVWFLTSLYLTGWRHGIVITLHNRKLLLLKGWKERIVRRFLSRARAVIFNDPQFVDLLVAKYGIDRSVMTVLPTYIPPTESERRGLPDDMTSFFSKHRYTISTNASILKRNVWGDVYGFDQIIGMMDILVNRKGMDVGLLFLFSILGDREYFDQCVERIRSLGLTDRFMLVIGSDVNGFEVWEKSDLFVRATNSDMEGISVKEALQFGTPVVASDVCTRPAEAVIYHKGDVEELAQKCADELESGKHVDYHPQADVPAKVMEIYNLIRG